MNGHMVQLTGICLMAVFIVIAVIYIATFKKRRNKLLEMIQKEY